MTIVCSSRALLCTVLLIALITLPVSGADASANATGTVQPYISAEVSPSQATVGTPVTVSGVATGGNLTAGVQIWVFAGNYVNVSTAPVNADNTFSKTYQTASLPPATYYVIVQSPGNNGVLDISMETTGQYSGQVVNTKTGTLVFNFTGTGSVQDSAAATALSDAFNLPGVDDVYTKCTLDLVAPVTATPVSTTVAPTPVATTKKSPLSLFTLIAGAGVATLAMAWRSRR
ncbi:MAG: hypothetical protein LUQ71_10920 [Methanoregula sp.]|nr:hypothetical protein [Methanoregula sp.]